MEDVNKIGVLEGLLFVVGDDGLSLNQIMEILGRKRVGTDSNAMIMGVPADPGKDRRCRQPPENV